MPKTIKNAFWNALTFEKLLESHYRARKHKTFKPELIEFEFNLENNIVNLLHQLKNHTYKMGHYRSFTIYEPKKRIIQALPYRDRIVHQWYVEEFIKPYVVPKFISTTFACLPERGTHKAVECVQHQMQVFKRSCENFWILKCDIRKFFYSINPYILFSIMKKHISDPELIYLTKLLIFSHMNSTAEVGIPIGYSN